jgi:HK97 family phage major capsid protein
MADTPGTASLDEAVNSIKKIGDSIVERDKKDNERDSKFTDLAKRVDETATKVSDTAKVVDEIRERATNRGGQPWSQTSEGKDRQFSYAKALQARYLQARGGEGDGVWTRNKSEFERDTFQQAERDFGHLRTPGYGGGERTTVVTTSAPAGGFLVPDAVGGYSDLLRARNPIFSKFGTEIIQTTGIPYRYNRMSAGATLTAVNEASAITETSVTFEQDQYLPKKYAGFIPLSAESVMMADPSVEAAVRGELLGRASVNCATQFLTGTGAANPTGIFVDSRIITTSTAVDPLTLAGLLNYVEQLKTNNALLDGARLGWVMHPLAETAIFLVAQNGTGSGLLLQPASAGNEGLSILGMPYATTTVLGGTEGAADLGLVDWSQVALLRWGALQVDMNANPQWTSDNVLVRVIDRFNVLIRQPKAIVFGTAIGKAA